MRHTQDKSGDRASFESRANPEVEHERDTLKVWLTEWVASYLEREPLAIDPNVDLSQYHFDSLGAVELTGALENLLKITLSPTIVYEHPTIQSLTDYLIGDPRYE